MWIRKDDFQVNGDRVLSRQYLYHKIRLIRHMIHQENKFWWYISCGVVGKWVGHCKACWE